MENLFALCYRAARQIVQGTKSQYPGCENATGFDVGGGSEDVDTSFSRIGATQQIRSYPTLPAELTSILSQWFGMPQYSQAGADIERIILLNLLGKATEAVPGSSVISGIEQISPSSFSGDTALQNMADRNPYSKDYENAIGQLYDRGFEKSRALAQSGPLNVRGGTARQGFELGEIGAQNAMNKFRDVRQQQDKEAGVVQGAVQMMNAIEQLRRGSQLSASQLRTAGEQLRTQQALGSSSAIGKIRGQNQANVMTAAELLGGPTLTTGENLSGKGHQQTSASNWGVGISCCFIFLEALNGELPWYVRRGRDDFNTVARRNGYVWMSSWLVPWMRRSQKVMEWVNKLMIRPFLKVGAWHYGESKQAHPFLKVWCYGWFYLWSFLGTVKKLWQ